MFDLLFDSVPHQFETAATVAVYGHCKQSLTHEVNQSAGKIDRQQDAEDLQNGERLLQRVDREIVHFWSWPPVAR